MNTIDQNNRKSIYLLQLCTILEYFDLMLYVHLSVFLNKLFFPATDPHIQTLLTAFTFSSTYFLRPLGGVLFGYIGDQLGRKFVVMLTTMLMSVSCLVMASLPTYEEIGIAASVIMIICRTVQCLSSMAEVMGSGVYITEATPAPYKYFATTLLGVSASVGGVLALGASHLVFSTGISWRYAFYMGALVAITGVGVRVKLRETVDFSDVRRRIKASITSAREEGLEKLSEPFLQQIYARERSVSVKTLISFFFMYWAWPFIFYFTYIQSWQDLSDRFNYSPAAIAQHNFYLSLATLLTTLSVCFLVYKLHPLRLIRLRSYLFIPLIISVPFWLQNLSSPTEFFILQLAILTLGPGATPGMPVFLRHLPLLRRFTFAGLLFGLATALGSMMTTLLFSFAKDFLGAWSFTAIGSITFIGYLYGLQHFERLESKKRLKHVLKHTQRHGTKIINK